MRLRGTGYFPNEGSPRVWFVKVEAEGLNELAAPLRAGVQELGLATDDQAFKAHITLARKKGPAPRVPPITFELGWTANGGSLRARILRKTGPHLRNASTFRFRSDAVRSHRTPPAGRSPQPTDSTSPTSPATVPHPPTLSPGPDPTGAIMSKDNPKEITAAPSDNKERQKAIEHGHEPDRESRSARAAS